MAQFTYVQRSAEHNHKIQRNWKSRKYEIYRLYCTKMLEHKSSLKNVWYTMAGYLIILAPAINKEDVSKYVNLMHFSLKFSSRFQLIRHAKQKLFIISTYLTWHFNKKGTQLLFIQTLHYVYLNYVYITSPFLCNLKD